MENLSDNLVRDFEEKWWKACREVGLGIWPKSPLPPEPFLPLRRACLMQGDEEVLRQMLANSKGVLPHCVDTNNRRCSFIKTDSLSDARLSLHTPPPTGKQAGTTCITLATHTHTHMCRCAVPDHYVCSALHFAAALGKAGCCAMLCEAGAEVDYPDKDGEYPQSPSNNFIRLQGHPQHSRAIGNKSLSFKRRCGHSTADTPSLDYCSKRMICPIRHSRLAQMTRRPAVPRCPKP